MEEHVQVSKVGLESQKNKAGFGPKEVVNKQQID